MLFDNIMFRQLFRPQRGSNTRLAEAELQTAPQHLLFSEPPINKNQLILCREKITAYCDSLFIRINTQCVCVRVCVCVCVCARARKIKKFSV